MFERYKHIVPHIALGSGVIDTVVGWLRDAGYKKVLVVSDLNTYRVAGKRVISSLRDADVSVSEFCFPDDEPLPDELSVGQLLAAYTLDVDLILGAGSGTINDICTYVGARVKCPSAIVGTAPSMDGYASLGSAMLLDGVKITPPTQCPVAIFCDTDILSQAPMHMIAAGLGDMLGKITSLADWRLSHLLTGEPMPQEIYSLMESALGKVLESAEGAARRDPKAIENITEGLILSGIAMSLYGDSRPASGTEHHLAHFWEMRSVSFAKRLGRAGNLPDGKVSAKHRLPALHGIKVGFATVLALDMWKRLADSGDTPLASAAAYSQNAQNTAAEAQYSLKVAERFIEYTEHENRPRVQNHTEHENRPRVQNPVIPPEHINSHWQDILEIARSLPSPDYVAGMLSSVGIEMRPKDIGLSADTLHDSVIYARERKKTFTLLQLLGNLGLLEAFADSAGEYFAGRALSGIKCFVLDMDGTVYLGDKLFPYTLDFLAHLKKLGKDYVFFTNNSSQNATHYINKLKRMGIEIPDEKLLMSTHVLLDWLSRVDSGDGTFCHQALGDKTYRPHCQLFVAGTQALKDDFTAAGYTLTEDNPDFCVLGFDTDMDYERLTKLCDFVRSGVPVYGVNMDYNCPVEKSVAQTGFIPDCGSLGAAVTASTGVQIEFFGKPSRRALDYIIKTTGYREEELCFIGDRLYTDIAIADGTKARSVLVLSGETKKEDIPQSPYVPDLIVDDLRVLQELI